MAIQMTRAEYEAKYGVKPAVSVAPTSVQPTQPKVQMTRAEYQAKYGVAPTTPAPKEPSIAQQRQARIDQGLAVSANPERVEPTLGGEIVRGIVKAPLKVALSIPAAVRGPKGVTVHSKYLGDTSDLAKETEKFAQRYVAKMNAKGEKITLGKAALASLGNAALQTADVATVIPVGGAAESVAKNTVEALAKEGAEQVAKKTATTVAKNVAKSYARGAGTGAVYDISQQAAEGDKINLKQTAGAAAVGGLIDTGLTEVAPAVLGKTKGALDSVLTKEGRTNAAIAKTENELKKFERYQSVKKITENARDKKNNPIKMLASNADVLKGAVDDTGTLKTLGEGSAHEKYTQRYVKPAESVVRKNLEIEGNKISLAEVEKRLLKEVNSSNLEGEALLNAQAKVDREIAGLAARAENVIKDDAGKIIDGEIPVVKIHDAKVNKYDTIDYLNPAAKKADKTIARTYKNLVQENTKSINVEKINQDLGRHYEVLNLLEKLDNKKVEGGKLGKYIARGIGAVVGSHFGPVGALAGSEAAGFLKGKLMASKFSSNAVKLIEQSPELKKALKNIADAKTVAEEKATISRLRKMLEEKNVKPAEVPALYEEYIPEDKLPVIQVGPTPKPKKSNLPTVGEDETPKVYSPLSLSKSQNIKTAATKIPISRNIDKTVTPIKKVVKFPKKVAVSNKSGKTVNLPRGNSLQKGNLFEMEVFRGGKGTSPSGTFYSPDKKIADSYAKRKGGTVTKEVVTLKNPLVIDAHHDNAINQIINKIEKTDPKLVKKFEEALPYVRGNRYSLMKDKKQAGQFYENDIIENVDPIFKEYANKYGYDGIVRMNGKNVFEVVDLKTKKSALPKKK